MREGRHPARGSGERRLRFWPGARSRPARFCGCQSEAQGPAPLGDPAAHERRGRDQTEGEDPTGDACPSFRRLDRLAAEHRAHGEEERGTGSRGETGAKQQVEAATLDGEPDPGEDGNDRRRENDARIERQAEVRELVTGPGGPDMRETAPGQRRAGRRAGARRRARPDSRRDRRAAFPSCRQGGLCR